jgi:hypothetical protein
VTALKNRNKRNLLQARATLN